MQTEFTCIKRLGAGHKADLKIGKHDASTNADEPRKLRLTEGAGERFQDKVGAVELGSPAPGECRQVAFQIRLS